MSDTYDIFSNGFTVIQNHIFGLVMIVILVIVIQFIIQKIINMPNWLFKITFPIVTIGTFLILIFIYYLPGIFSNL
ncbi:hypothetical protein P9B03_09070 [Metasolibacillus meyeri]|uniref:Uncharacterized protein n=1 Tax=Metasolibacillus meyeri TaxID=1071052 RepID=A0AAW9NQL6_9BACL|nr:hypothetical protein [Metasolibacillus meyeri]MEC1178632.1 hypothetical protein [Metasolibacillus meyeri]